MSSSGWTPSTRRRLASHLSALGWELQPGSRLGRLTFNRGDASIILEPDQYRSLSVWVFSGSGVPAADSGVDNFGGEGWPERIAEAANAEADRLLKELEASDA